MESFGEVRPSLIEFKDWHGAVDAINSPSTSSHELLCFITGTGSATRSLFKGPVSLVPSWNSWMRVQVFCGYRFISWCKNDDLQNKSLESLLRVFFYPLPRPGVG